jgi:hypothetical protein
MTTTQFLNALHTEGNGGEGGGNQLSHVARGKDKTAHQAPLFTHPESPPSSSYALLNKYSSVSDNRTECLKQSEPP